MRRAKVESNNNAKERHESKAQNEWDNIYEAKNECRG